MLPAAINRAMIGGGPQSRIRGPSLDELDDRGRLGLSSIHHGNRDGGLMNVHVWGGDRRLHQLRVMRVIDFTPAMHAKAVVRTASGFTQCLTLELSNAE